MKIYRVCLLFFLGILGGLDCSAQTRGYQFGSGIGETVAGVRGKDLGRGWRP